MSGGERGRKQDELLLLNHRPQSKISNVLYAHVWTSARAVNIWDMFRWALPVDNLPGSIGFEFGSQQT